MFFCFNNTGNTQVISALRTTVGASGRAGQVIGRAGEHQRGGLGGGGYPRNKSPATLIGRRQSAKTAGRV